MKAYKLLLLICLFSLPIYPSTIHRFVSRVKLTKKSCIELKNLAAEELNCYLENRRRRKEFIEMLNDPEGRKIILDHLNAMQEAVQTMKEAVSIIEKENMHLKKKKLEEPQDRPEE
jgi:hypothetical protein